MIFKLKKLIKILGEPSFVSALLKGSAAGVEHIVVLSTLGDVKHILDIGANRGQFALASRKCFPRANVDSFEPLEEPRRIFKSVFYGDQKVKLFPLAIGPLSGEAVIHVSERDDSSSLLPIDDAQTNLFPETAEKETRVIQVSTLCDVYGLDAAIDIPALLKIDVQGFELSTLKGCESLLHKFKYVYVECSFIELYTGQSLATDVISYLTDRKFRLIGVHNMYYDQSGKAIQADFLFQNNESNSPA